MDNDSIKDNILRLRKIRGLSQTEAARRCGISMTHYRSLESGQSCLVNPLLPRIAEVLDIGVGCLIFGSWNREERDFRLEDEEAGYGFSDNIAARSDKRCSDMREEYEARLQKAGEENTALRRTVEAQKRDISHLESMVRLLRRLKGVDDI